MARQGAGETHVVLISMLRTATTNYCVDDRGGRAKARADARADALLFIRGDVRGDVLRGLLVARDFAANALDVLRLDEHVGVVEIGDDEFRLRGGDVVEVEDVLFDRDNVTPSPTDSTTPAASCPRMHGNFPSESCPPSCSTRRRQSETIDDASGSSRHARGERFARRARTVYASV